jgi:preprotein translocase subunit SecD
MTGEIIESANVVADQLGQYQVDITFTSEGGKQFGDYTGTHVNTVLGIVLDKVLISAPTISTKIDQGQGQITGNFTAEGANQLAVQLRFGSLPIPLKVVETRAIGPSLGQDSLQKSLVAGGIGAVIVLLFMLLYYRLPGSVAGLALLIYGVITFAQ